MSELTEILRQTIGLVWLFGDKKTNGDIQKITSDCEAAINAYIDEIIGDDEAETFGDSSTAERNTIRADIRRRAGL